VLGVAWLIWRLSSRVVPPPSAGPKRYRLGSRSFSCALPVSPEERERMTTLRPAVNGSHVYAGCFHGPYESHRLLATDAM